MRYIPMGTTSHLQAKKESDLQATTRRVQQKLSTDITMIAPETTNAEKFPQALVCVLRMVSGHFILYNFNLCNFNRYHFNRSQFQPIAFSTVRHFDLN